MSKYKRFTFIMLLCGILLMLISAVAPIAWKGLLFALLLFSICLTVSAVFCLLFAKTVQTYCAVKTSAIALVLSAIGGFGLSCVLLWFTVVAFGEVSRHPFAYPGSILLGLCALCAFAVLIGVYMIQRRKI